MAKDKANRNAMRQTVRDATFEQGALWLLAVLEATGAERLRDLRGDELRFAAHVLPHFTSHAVPLVAALAKVKAAT